MASKPTAIVTGAAGGIGRPLSERLLRRGYRVVLVDIDAQKGKELQKELGPDTLFVECDVADWDSSAAMFKSAHEWAGRIDVFMANAGIEEREFFYHLPGKDGGEPVKPNMAVVEVDLNSVIYGLRLFRHYRRMSAQDGTLGKMIATSSLAGFYAFPASPIYSSAKSGVVALVRSSSHKLRHDEAITINAISPGPVDTTISEFMKTVVPPERFTPLELVLQAAERILDEDITGQVFECSNQQYYQRQPVDYADENPKFLIEDMTRFLAAR